MTTRTSRTPLWTATALLALCLSLVAASHPAKAAGGGGGGGGGGGSNSEAAALDPDYRAGIDAARLKDWPQVVARMRLVTQRDPSNADAWNELGHAYRLTGDMDNSFKHYERALKINPQHRGAHEYLGEAYLQVGKLEMAEQELKTLSRLCLITCEEYRDLKGEIERYKRERSKAASVTMP